MREEVAQLREEGRIKDARMARIPAPRRPHDSPVERLEILQLRAARKWSLQQTTDAFLVTPETIASWMKRLDEQGSNALLEMPEPVNRFPDRQSCFLLRRGRGHMTDQREPMDQLHE